MEKYGPIKFLNSSSTDTEQETSEQKYGPIEFLNFVQNREGEEEGTIQEIGEGVLSGLIGIGQGIGELGASAVDLVADTDYASAVTEGAENLRSDLGIDPEGLAGTIAEIGTQFVLPGLGAAAMVSKATRLGRLATASRAKPGLASMSGSQKFALGAQQVAAAGLADATVATDNIRTIGDFFEGGPTETDREIGLTGREEAARRIGNKLKIGLESAGIAAVLPPALSGVLGIAGAGVAKAGTSIAASPVTQAAAQKVQGGLDTVSGALKRVEDERVAGNLGYRATDTVTETGEVIPGGLGSLAKNSLLSLVEDTRKVLTYRGNLPQAVATARGNIAGSAERNIRLARKNVDRLDKEMDAMFSKLAKDGGTTMQRQNAMDAVFRFFTEPGAVADKMRILDGFTPSAKRAITGMRQHVSNLSENVMQGAYVRNMPETARKEAEEIFTRQIDSYMRRKYRAFEESAYTASAAQREVGIQGYMKNAKQTIGELRRIVQNNPVMVRNADGDVVKQIDEAGETVLTKEGQEAYDLLRVIEEDKVIPLRAAELATDNFLKRYSVKTVQTDGKRRAVAQRLNTGLMKNRSELESFQRELLGEIKDPRKVYAQTAADMAQFRAVDDFHGEIRRLIDDGDAATVALFKQPGSFASKEAAQTAGFRELASEEFGAIRGFYVPQRVYDDLTKRVIEPDGAIGEMAMAMYSGFLRAKGMSQYVKTILSPITQIRNVTTASAFAMAQGNVGRGANLMESLNIVFRDTFEGVGTGATGRVKPNKEQVDEFVGELMEAGVLGTQAEVRELKALIDEGFGFRATKEIQGNEFTGSVLKDTLNNTKMAPFFKSAADKIRSPLKRAEDAYQAGDNLWKIYGYTFEKNKLQNAFRNMSQEDQIRHLQSEGQMLGRELEEFSRLKKAAADAAKADSPVIARTVEGFERAADKMISDAVKKVSADIVRNTIPNYNLAPEILKQIRKMPVGNFIAFPYEIYRTGGNTLTRAIKELTSDSAAIREIGLRRMTGALGTFFAIPATTAAFAHSVSGVSEEEMNAYRRSFAPPWERNSRLIPTGRDSDGNITYVNFSYSNPYDLLERGFRTALNEIETGRALGKDADAIAFNVLFESMRESFNSFLAPSIMTNKVADVSVRGGRTETGARIFNPEDSAGDKLAKSFVHIMDGVLPSALPLQVRGGKFEASRFARGVLGDTMLGDALGIDPNDRRGRDFDLATELMRGFTGITELVADTEQSLGYKGFEFGRARTNAANIFNREASSENATRESLLDAYITADEARYRVYNNFHQAIQDLRTMGVGDLEVSRILRKNRVGDVNSVLSNRYEPLEISSQIRANMMENGNDRILPSAEINNYQAQRRGARFEEAEPLFDGFDLNLEFNNPFSSDPEPVNNSALTPPVAPPVAPQPMTTGSLADFYSAPGATSGVLTRISRQSIEDSAKARGTTPQQLIQTAGLQPVQPDASLLGDDPVTIARNMQIAQRTRRG